MTRRLRWLWPLLCAVGCYDLHTGPPERGSSAGAADDSAVTLGADAASRGGMADAPRAGAGAGASAPDASVSVDDDAGLASDARSPLSPDFTLRALGAPEPSLRVAFVGDQALGPSSTAVLSLIAAEDAAFVVHAGDFDYVNDPAAWEAQIDATLGASFPYFATVGNHDLPGWDAKGGYRERLLGRLSRTAGARCDGDYGVNSLCRYRGLAFVLSGVGTLGEGHEAYLDEALSVRRDVWRLCVWHKNQHDLQVGTKGDEVGWLAYQRCATHGAAIITAHEHSYARTYALLAIGSHDAGHGAVGGPYDVQLDLGRTLVFVTGLGGHSSRAFGADHAGDTWWASIYARGYQLHNGVVTGVQPAIEFGVLFIDFHVDGNPHKARGYFKTLSGAIADDFELTTR